MKSLILAVVGIGVPSLFMVAFASSNVLAQESPTDPNQEIVRQLIQTLVVGGNLSAVPNFISPNFIDNDTGHTGYAAMSSRVTEIHQAFSSLEVKINEMESVGDLVITHDLAVGVLAAGPGKGMNVYTHETAVFRLLDGKLIEHWSHQAPLTSNESLAIQFLDCSKDPATFGTCVTPILAPDFHHTSPEKGDDIHGAAAFVAFYSEGLEGHLWSYAVTSLSSSGDEVTAVYDSYVDSNRTGQVTEVFTVSNGIIQQAINSFQP